jgi:transposase
VRPPPKKELVKHERSAGPFVGLVVSYISAERRVPPDHPLQSIRVMVDAALKELGPRFHAIYANNGRPSIPPDKPCGRCCCRCSIARSERQPMEQLDYNLLFRWFVGLSMDDPD